MAALDHIEDTSRRATHDMQTVLQTANILGQVLATNATVNLDIHKVAQSKTHFLRLFGQFASRAQNKDLRFSYGEIEGLESA